MKKITIIIALIALSKIAHAQSTWVLALNQITGSATPDFGTKNNFPINFFTNNTTKMVLGADGTLKINNLAGSGNRFLNVDSEGKLVSWSGSGSDNNKVLYGDGSFKTAPVLGDVGQLYTTITAKFGIGTTTPGAKLDVVGNARFSQPVGSEKAVQFGTALNGYGTIQYIAETTDMPPIIYFGAREGVGGGGGAFPGNGDIGIIQQPKPGDLCSPGSVQSIHDYPTAAYIDADIYARGSAAYNGTPYGLLRMGHNGKEGYLEVQGTTNSSVAAPLLINACAKRNVYVFGTQTFAPASFSVMSIKGSLNVTEALQLGSTANNFVDNTESRLYVTNEPGNNKNCIKVRQDVPSDHHGVLMVTKDDYTPALGVYKTIDASDGDPRFIVWGDGRTGISTTNNEAFIIEDAANNNKVKFKVNKSGKTEIGSDIQANTSVLTVGQSTKANPAFILTDNTSTTNKDFFTVYGSGYTEINVRSLTSMPFNRVLAIKEVTGPGTTKDLFVVKSDGKVYAREVEISIANPFPDYVFSKAYKLKTINEVESFITKNKHLPNFEKGEYYEKNGVNVTDILIKQQEQLETQMLYIIQLEKRLLALEKTNNP